MTRGGVIALATILAVAPALATGVTAQTVTKHMTRSFDGEPYWPSRTFFTALGAEGVLTFSRVVGTCPDFGNCNDADDCHGGQCVAGTCTGNAYVYPNVGQVAVVKKAEFCRAAVCGDVGTGFLPPECDPALYPCTTPCPTPNNCNTCPLAPGFCLCNGGNQCDAPDAPLSPSQAPFNETFQTLTTPNPWVFSRATIHPGSTDGFLELGEDALANGALVDSIAHGSVRFALVPGEEYVLFVKHSFVPFSGGLQCATYGGFDLHFEGRNPICDTDGDGYPVDLDCNDGVGSIHPAQPDAVCDAVDQDCDGVADEDYASLPDDWTPVPLDAVAARYDHTLVTAGSRAIVWGGRDGSGTLSSGAIFDPGSLTWIRTRILPATQGRSRHTAVWTGSEMILWGGLTSTGTPTNTGQRYDPATDTFTAMNAVTAPPARFWHTAVWTGNRMIVWGGVDAAGNALQSGGIYNPANNTWTATSMLRVPSARWQHTAVWTGSRMIVWGGHTDVGLMTATGASFDPAGNSWTTLPSGAPTPRAEHTAIWDGTSMIVWGGLTAAGHALGNGARYLPASSEWLAIADTGFPPARWAHAAVWTGTEMIVWGGRDAGVLTDGARLKPATGEWSAMNPFDQPSPRRDAPMVWLPSVGKAFVWGGLDSGELGDGGLYLVSSQCGVGACSRSGGTFCGAGSIEYACIPGTPVTEACNAIDDDCDGPIDEGVPPVSLPGPDLTVSASGANASIAWTPAPNGQAGDLVTGSLSLLRSAAGNYASATTGCLANDVFPRSAIDANTPPVGDGFFYVARDVNSCSGPGTYDEGSASQVGSRDAGIQSSAGACP
ncbi:MAG TPA: MopE-related protein [Candidatus Polarisedimenticolia bacterium]|nr:MopE-related protein [Candidatus Polarisedimenticolia bacterium]